jgi:hypothetical protein
MMPTVYTRRVFDYLKRCACERRLVAYGEIAKQVGIAPMSTGRHLGYIRDNICRARDLPWLNAIAVNAKALRPGYNYIPPEFAPTRGNSITWDEMVRRVFAYEWEHVNFDE